MSFRRICVTLLLLALACTSVSAQFRSTRNDVSGNTRSGTVTGPPGSETNNTSSRDTTVATDTIQGFSVRKLVRGYFTQDTLTPGYMLLGTALVPGAAQIYNRQWWKVPIIYAGMGAGIYTGIWSNRQYQHTGEDKYRYLRTAGYVAAGAFYWAQMLDGAICYKTPIKAPVPAKSTIYSLLLPGLGQANNGDWWKIPIWTGGLVACGYFYHFNDMQYKRFRWITQMDRNTEETGYIGKITAQQAETYRDQYRRWRDYSILATIIVYALNVIDAHVFAYMADFDVSDNIAWVEVQPTVIQPIVPQYASYDGSAGTGSSTGSGSRFNQPALGLNLQFTF